MNSHLPDTLSHMYIGDVSGCHEVPDPICPRFITFPDLADPILIPIPASDITRSGSMLEMSPLICIPGIWPEGLGDGVAPGAGVACVCVVFPGDGVAAGAGIACVCVAFPGDGEAVGDGVAAGVGVACVCVVFPGDGEGDAAGIFIPGI
jgi:hypothetical protein